MTSAALMAIINDGSGVLMYPRGLLAVALVAIAGAGSADPISESGTLIASFLQSAIGPQLTFADQIYMVHAAETALNEALPGQTVAWRNAENGHSGWTTPLSGAPAPGLVCRVLRQGVRLEGDAVETQDEACRVPNGSWRRME